jgi:hypothetical protein
MGITVSFHKTGDGERGADSSAAVGMADGTSCMEALRQSKLRVLDRAPGLKTSRETQSLLLLGLHCNLAYDEIVKPAHENLESLQSMVASLRHVCK